MPFVLRILSLFFERTNSGRAVVKKFTIHFVHLASCSWEPVRLKRDRSNAEMGLAKAPNTSDNLSELMAPAYFCRKTRSSFADPNKRDYVHSVVGKMASAFTVSARGFRDASILCVCWWIIACLPPQAAYCFPQTSRVAETEAEVGNESLDERIASLESQLKEQSRPSLFEASWKNGLNVASRDGEFKARFGGRVEQDWIWITGDNELEAAVGELEDGVFFRRARIQGNGTVYGVIDYFAEFEFAPVENIVFQDVWIQLNQTILGKVRAGHLKVPFGLENETSARHLTFLERSAVHDAFQQEYDPGIMVWDTFGPNDDFRYAVSYLRFDPRESGSSLGNGEHSFAARLSGAPLRSEDDRWLFHLGGSIRLNNATAGPIPGQDGFQFRARPEFRNTPRFVDTGFFEADGAIFLGAEAAVVVDSFSIQAEFVSTMIDDANPFAAAPVDVRYSGYYVLASYFVTGEHRPYSRNNGAFGRISPKNPVKRSGTGGVCWGGAVELKARYSHVDLDDSSFNSGKLENGILGLNWYLNPNTKVMIDYNWARRDSIVSGDSHGLGMRLYVEF